MRWLEDVPGMFDELGGVAREDAFTAELSFHTVEAATRLAGARRSGTVPATTRSSASTSMARASTSRSGPYPLCT